MKALQSRTRFMVPTHNHDWAVRCDGTSCHQFVKGIGMLNTGDLKVKERPVILCSRPFI